MLARQIDKTTIQVSKETHQKLTAQGKMGESYDSLILRLLKELEDLRFENKQQQAIIRKNERKLKS